MNLLLIPYTGLPKTDILGIGLQGVAKAKLAEAFRLFKRLITRYVRCGFENSRGDS